MGSETTFDRRYVFAAMLVSLLLFSFVSMQCSDSGSNPTQPGDTLSTGDDDSTDDSTGDSTAELFTVSPLPCDSIKEIVVLGNLNPTGHVYPTDHVYWYLPIDEGSSTPDLVTLYCPGTILLTRATIQENVTQAVTDYSLEFTLASGVYFSFGHVSSLSTSIFGDVSGKEGFTLQEEYSTGGNTYRTWARDYSLTVTAGAVLGTAGGNQGQYALDLNLYDWNQTIGEPANDTIWQWSRQVHALCPLDQFEPGAVRDSLWDLVSRTAPPGDDYPCGSAMQDVAATAQGIWFKPGESAPYPEDPHLALVWHNIDASNQAFSVGNSIPTISSGVYTFTPNESGRLNRRFDQVTSDGNIYGYLVYYYGAGEMTMLVELTDSVTMKIEGILGHVSDSTSWSFTEAATTFQR